MGKTALITGGARGIGRAITLLFARNGYNVIINYLNSEGRAQKLARAINSKGGAALALRADVSDMDEVEYMVSNAAGRFGGISVLINNAGIAQTKLFCDLTPADWGGMMAVNSTGVFNCCRAVAPLMLREKRGSIINISSIWGIAGAACEVHYSAAKASVIGLTKALAKELGPSGITVNCVAPGVIKTRMNAGLVGEGLKKITDETPLCRVGSARHVAESVLFLARSGFITGQVISPNGGLVI